MEYAGEPPDVGEPVPHKGRARGTGKWERGILSTLRLEKRQSRETEGPGAVLLPEEGVS